MLVVYCVPENLIHPNARSFIYLLLVFGLILWKWMNGMDSLCSNQECRIGYKNSHKAEYLSAWQVHVLRNLEIAEVLRDYVASNPPGERIGLFLSSWLGILK